MGEIKNSLAQKTIFITGASRGIGREIALRCAQDGANVIVAAKTMEPHPRLSGTILSVAQEIEEKGGKALPLQLDVRHEDQIELSVAKAVQQFGGIDILVNNAGAIRLTRLEETPAKSFDLMMAVNVRAAFLCTKACVPHLQKAKNPHVLNLSPPITLAAKWLENHVAYTISKYGMSFCTIGMAAELKAKGIAVNSLWPKTAIATAAIEMLLGKEAFNHSRKPQIVADAAYHLFLQPAASISGQLLLDEEFLKDKAGITDFTPYAFSPGANLISDFYVDS